MPYIHVMLQKTVKGYAHKENASIHSKSHLKRT